MNFNELSFAVRFLDPLEDQGAVRVKASRMRAIQALEADRLNALFFGDKEEVFLSRKELMSIPRREADLFTISVLYWCYPNNNWQRCTYAMRAWNDLIALVRDIRNHRNMSSDYYAGLEPIMAGIHNLNISIYSKLFYFAKASIDGYPCVILDNNVMAGIDNLEGEVFEELKSSVIGTNRYRVYLRYLQAMGNLAAQIGVPAQNIEYALWLAGRNGL